MPGYTMHFEFLRQLKNLLNLFRVVGLYVQALLVVRHVSVTSSIFWQQTPLIGSTGPSDGPREQKSKPLLIQFRQFPPRSIRMVLRDPAKTNYEINKSKMSFIFNYRKIGVFYFIMGLYN